MLVVIREADCIGCTKCIQACPVDAILGSMNQMHTVIAKECIGCELCIAPCPVDCIDLLDIKPEKNKELTLKRVKARKQRDADKNTDSHATSMHGMTNVSGTDSSSNVLDTLARIKALKAAANRKSTS